jgi:hypothetical protein
LSRYYHRDVEIDWTSALAKLATRVETRLQRSGGDWFGFIQWVATYKPVILQDWLHPNLILSRGGGYIAEYMEEMRYLRSDVKGSALLEDVEALVRAYFEEFPNMQAAYGGKALYYAREEAKKALQRGASRRELLSDTVKFSKRGGDYAPSPRTVFYRRKGAGSVGRHAASLSDELQWRVDLLRKEGLGRYIQAQGVGSEDDPYRLEVVYETATGKEFRLGLFYSRAVRSMLERLLSPVRKTIAV